MHDRIKVLDGLRALAIFLVMARHSIRPFWTDFDMPFLGTNHFDLARFLMNGWCGVDLFFVLSGFLIGGQLIAAQSDSKTPQHQNLFRYLKRRFFRIAPAYYLLLTLVCLGLFPPYPITDPNSVWGWRYIYHLLFLHDYFPPDILPLFWSLAIEFKFYLLAPLLVALILKLKTDRARLATLAATLLALITWRYDTVSKTVSDDYESYFLTIRILFHMSLDGLLMGLSAAFIWHSEKLRALITQSTICNALFFSGLALFLGLTTPTLLLDKQISLFDKTLLVPLLSSGFTMMMLGLLGGCAAQQLFEFRALKGIALISYSLYLIHMPMVFVALHVVGKFMPSVPLTVEQWLFFLLPYTIFSLCFAGLIYFYVEKPLIDWSKR